jgi:hypothetical protein
MSCKLQYSEDRVKHSTRSRLHDARTT